MFDLSNWANPHGDACLMTFGFLLPKPQEFQAIQLSAVVAKNARLRYQLDASVHLPLLRMYEAVFPQKNLEAVKDEARKEALIRSPIQMKWAEVEETEDALILWGEEDEELLEFQYQLMSRLNHLREGYYKQKYNLYTLNPNARRSLDRWGWVYGSDYSPYVVLAQPETKFDLSKFEVEWDFSRAILSKFVMALKTAPGQLTHREIVDLAAKK